MKRLIPILLAGLAACSEPQVNPPTEPAAAIPIPEEAALEPVRPGITPTLPGRGPASFVGRWAASRSWCANTSGPEQPIAITTTRFEGYENGCDIAAIDQVQGGYVAQMSCMAEGVVSTERLRLGVGGDTLSLTWVDRKNVRTELTRCPAADPPPPTDPAS